MWGLMGDRDVDAFRVLYRRHYGAVHRFLSTRTEPDQVEDLAAETFLVAWRKSRSVPDMQLPWLLNVATKVLANDHRAGRRRAALVERLAQASRLDSPTVDADAERRSQRRATVAALATLRDEDRELLLLHLWDDLRPREIAVVLGAPPMVVRARLSRARRRLQRALDAELARPCAAPPRMLKPTEESNR